MAGCERTHQCGFFSEATGYSPELQGEMQLHYCLCAVEECARLKALEDLPEHAVPDDLLPTDHDRLRLLVTQYSQANPS